MYTCSHCERLWKRRSSMILLHCCLTSTDARWHIRQRQCPLHCCWRTTWTTRSTHSRADSFVFVQSIKVQLDVWPAASFYPRQRILFSAFYRGELVYFPPIIFSGYRLSPVHTLHGLSGLFRVVSAVEPSLFRPLPTLSPRDPNKPSRFRGRKATVKKKKKHRLLIKLDPASK